MREVNRREPAPVIRDGRSVKTMLDILFGYFEDSPLAGHILAIGAGRPLARLVVRDLRGNRGRVKMIYVVERHLDRSAIRRRFEIPLANGRLAQDWRHRAANAAVRCDAARQCLAVNLVAGRIAWVFVKPNYVNAFALEGRATLLVGL